MIQELDDLPGSIPRRGSNHRLRRLLRRNAHLMRSIETSWRAGLSVRDAAALAPCSPVTVQAHYRRLNIAQKGLDLGARAIERDLERDRWTSSLMSYQAAMARRTL